ncbi:MAG: hypothetical protein ABWJ99_02205 [Caldimicrobium sp.]
MRCPGQDWRYWKEDAIFEISCPFCGEKVEFFKDDTTRKCPSCKKVIPNPKLDFGCAAYCKYAEVCLGELPPELIREKANLLKSKILSLLEEMLPKELYSEIQKGVETLERELKEKGSSPGTKLLLLLFYYLSPDERENLYKKAGLPETLWEEIKITLKNYKEGLNPEELIRELLK